MDNERAFSLACVTSRLRGNRAKVELVENLMQISLDYPVQAAESMFRSEEDFADDEVKWEEEMSVMKDIDLDNESTTMNSPDPDPFVCGSFVPIWSEEIARISQEELHMCNLLKHKTRTLARNAFTIACSCNSPRRLSNPVRTPVYSA